MSAYIVNDKTINRVVTYLNGDNDARHTKREVVSIIADHIANTENMAAALGQTMFELNVEAIKQRYPDDDPSEFRPLDYQYRLEIGESKIQVLSSLRCWLYQCAEGDVPETKLYRVMEEYSHHLALSIVYSLPEWNATEWG